MEAALSPILVILAAMSAIALLELLVPLHARGASARAHLRPNLALTFLTFATTGVLNAALVMALFWLEVKQVGLLRGLALPPLLIGAAAVVALDFSVYVTHVAMHKLPAFWRFHSVHHCDPAVDVTTTIRQHPGESLIRYASLGAFALALGVGPVAFGVHRAASALIGLLEHANLRMPRRIDRALAWITTWPYMHKLHHSRNAAETDTNYSNIFSVWDRLFGTFTPSERGMNIDYGLAGFDDAATQTTGGLLGVPFRAAGPSAALALRRLGHVEGEQRA